MTNNEAEYEASLTSLGLAKVARTSLVVICNDSQVIIRHVNEDFKAKSEQMKKYLSMIKQYIS